MPVDLSMLKNNNPSIEKDRGVNAYSATINTLKKVEPATPIDKEYYDKYAQYNIYPNASDSEEELNLERAKNQSRIEQIGNSLAQILENEVILGIPLMLSDIFDAVVNITKEITSDGTSNDFSNPLSEYLTQLQDENKKRLEIYRENPNKTFDIGDFGWWTDNLVSVGSTIAMLYGGNIVSGIEKGIFNLGKSALKTSKIGLKSKSLVNKVIPNALTRKKIAGIGEITNNAFIARIGENYQEARDVYKNTKEDALDRLSKLTEEQRKELLSRNPSYIGLTDEEIASKIAEDAGALTYSADFAMLLMDLPQYAALGPLFTRVPSRLSNSNLNIINKNAIRNLGKDMTPLVTGTTLQQEGINVIKGTKEGFIKNSMWNRLKNNFNSPIKILSSLELTEAIEEGYQGIMSEKGQEVADFVFDPTHTKRTLSSYLSDDKIWEQAFWGAIGGITFGLAGKGIDFARNRIDAKIEKKKYNEENDFYKTYFDKKKLTTEKQRELEILDRPNLLIDVVDKLDLISKGLNPLNTSYNEETKEINYAPLDENEKEVVTNAVLEDFLINFTLNATDVGNYDLLKEYVNSQEFKKYITDGNLDKSISDRFNSDINREMDKIYNLYINNLKETSQYITEGTEYASNILARNITRNQLIIDDINNKLDSINNELHITDNNILGAQQAWFNAMLDKLEEERKHIIDRYNEGLIPEITKNLLLKDNLNKLKILKNNFIINTTIDNFNIFKDVDFSKIEDNIGENQFKEIRNKFTEWLNNNEALLKDIESEYNTDELTKYQINLLMDSFNLQYEKDIIENEIPKTNREFKSQYDEIARTIDKTASDRVNSAVERITNYISKSENPKDALQKLYAGEEVYDGAKNDIYLLKTAFKDESFANTINALANMIEVAKEVNREKDEKATKDGSTKESIVTDIEASEAVNVVEEILKPENPIQKPIKIKKDEDASIPQYETVELTDDIEFFKEEDEEDVVPPEIDFAEPIIQSEVPDINAADTIATSLIYVPETLISDTDKNTTELRNQVLDNVKKGNYKELQNVVKDVLGNYNSLLEKLKLTITDDVVKHITDNILLYVGTYNNEELNKGIQSIYNEIIEGKDLYSKIKISTKLNDSDRIKIIKNTIKDILKERGIYDTEDITIEAKDFFNYLINEKGITDYNGLYSLYYTLKNNKDLQEEKEIISGIKNIKDFAIFVENELQIVEKEDFVGIPMSIVSDELGLTDVAKDIINKIQSGEIKNPNIKIIPGHAEQTNKDKASTLRIIYTRPNGEEIDLGYINQVFHTTRDNSGIMKYKSKGFLYNLKRENGQVNTKFDELFKYLNSEEGKILLNALSKTNNQLKESKESKELIEDILNIPIIKGLIEADNSSYDYSYGDRSIESTPKITTSFGDEIYVLPNNYDKISLHYQIGTDGNGKKYAIKAERVNPKYKNLKVSDFDGDIYRLEDYCRVCTILDNIRTILQDNKGILQLENIEEKWNEYKELYYDNLQATYDIQEQLLKNDSIGIDINFTMKQSLQQMNVSDEYSPIGKLFTNSYKKYPIVFSNFDGTSIDEKGNIYNTTKLRFQDRLGIVVGKVNGKDIIIYGNENKLNNSGNEKLIQGVKDTIFNIIDKYLTKDSNYGYEDCTRDLVELLGKDSITRMFGGLSIYVKDGYTMVYRTRDIGEQGISNTVPLFVINKYKNKEEKNKSIGDGTPNIVLIDSKSKIKLFLDIEDNHKKKGRVIEKLVNVLSNEITFHQSPFPIINGNKTSTNTKYFYKKDNKFVVELDGYKEEYDDYFDYIIKNNTILTKAKRGKDNKFYEATADYNTLHLTPFKEEITEIDRTEAPKDIKTLKNELKSAGTKVVETKNVLKSFGISDRVIESLFTPITYINGKPITIIDSNVEYNDKLDAFAQYKKEEDKVLIGKKLFDERIKNRNTQLIVSLLHENIHRQLHSDKLTEQHLDSIYNDLAETYNAFINYITENKIKSKFNSLKDLNPETFIENYVNSHINKENEANRDKIANTAKQIWAEEWLVESLTNPDLMNELNTIEYKETNVEEIKEEKKTLLQKIIDAIISLYSKIFNESLDNLHNIKNNTILAYHYSLVANEINNINEDNTSIPLKGVEQETNIKKDEEKPKESTQKITKIKIEKTEDEEIELFSTIEVSTQMNDINEEERILNTVANNPTINPTKHIVSSNMQESLLRQVDNINKPIMASILSDNQLDYICR